MIRKPKCGRYSSLPHDGTFTLTRGQTHGEVKDYSNVFKNIGIIEVIVLRVTLGDSRGGFWEQIAKYMLTNRERGSCDCWAIFLRSVGIMGFFGGPVSIVLNIVVGLVIAFWLSRRPNKPLAKIFTVLIFVFAIFFIKQLFDFIVALPCYTDITAGQVFARYFPSEVTHLIFISLHFGISPQLGAFYLGRFVNRCKKISIWMTQPLFSAVLCIVGVAIYFLGGFITKATPD